MNFSCKPLNELFCIDGPEYMDVDDTPIYANTGWGKRGWNHTDEAKNAISIANTKYSPEEKIQKWKESRDKSRDKRLEQQRKWREENREKKKEIDRLYRQNNKEKIQKYRIENKEKIKQISKKYYEKKKNKYEST
jgi:hypothetical protein